MIGLALLAAGVVGFGLVESGNTYALQVATSAGIVALSAVGLSLLVGGTGQISIGHAGFMAVGAYTSAKLLTSGVPFAVALPCAGLATVPFGLLVGLSALRLRGNLLAFATLAFGGIVFALLQEVSFFGGSRGIRNIPGFELPGINFAGPLEQYLLVWAVALVGYAVVLLVGKARAGRVLAAIRDDEVAVTALGINVAAYKIAAFVISAILAGLSGSLVASYQTAIVPARFDIIASIQLLVMVVVGGVYSPFGAVLGAVLLTVLPEFGREWERYRLMGYGVLIVLLMVFAPGGLLALGRDLLDRGVRVRGTLLSAVRIRLPNLP